MSESTAIACTTREAEPPSPPRWQRPWGNSGSGPCGSPDSPGTRLVGRMVRKSGGVKTSSSPRDPSSTRGGPTSSPQQSCVHFLAETFRHRRSWSGSARMRILLSKMQGYLVDTVDDDSTRSYLSSA